MSSSPWSEVPIVGSEKELIGELSPSEKKMILEYRQGEARRKAVAAFRLKVLKVAYEFEIWLQSHDEDSSLGVFTSNFGYKEDDFKLVYKAVTQLRRLSGNLLPVDEETVD
ncbi:hypothetical protein HNP46_005785 [Pseudomonas nitritireducens]|uniref:Uncharacterized protein n=1 Tax=Pseudomonas nitroreducens TaxID=46680 RepID=A0A7W7KQZ4_PSENT|nr:hypothetical protein [Pseudomonas nitritireducens]MBB4866878.1 hypothetical protein [Pseudomonas nitritireducens]